MNVSPLLLALLTVLAAVPLRPQEPAVLFVRTIMTVAALYGLLLVPGTSLGQTVASSSSLDEALSVAGARVAAATEGGDHMLLCRAQELVHAWRVYPDISHYVDAPPVPLERVHTWLLAYAASRCQTPSARIAADAWWSAQALQEEQALARLGGLDDQGCFDPPLTEPPLPPVFECGSTYLRDATGQWGRVRRVATWQSDDPTVSCGERLAAYLACDDNAQTGPRSSDCPLPSHIECEFPAPSPLSRAIERLTDAGCYREAAAVGEHHSEHHRDAPHSYEGLLNAAIIYDTGLEDLASAVAAYERLLELYPGSDIEVVVLRRLADVEMRLLNTDRAIEIYFELDALQRGARGDDQ